MLLLFVCFVFVQAKDRHKLKLHNSGLPRSEDVFNADANSINSDFINHGNQVFLYQGNIIGTLDVLQKEYFVSFDIFPKTYTKGWKNVIHLTQNKDFGDYGDRIPGVWFNEDGSGKLSIRTAVRGDNNFNVETDPLPLNQWTNIKIGQVMRHYSYWFFVYLDGFRIYIVENTDARDFKNVKVYASDPWYAAQNGLISNILIINGNAENIVGSIPSELVKGKLVAEIPKLKKEYLVSFDVYPSKFVAGQHSVIHFSIGSDLGHYGDRVPGIWFNADGKGGLYVSAPINGNFDKFFITNPIGLNEWSNIEISQILRNSVYIYTIKINKEIVFSEINNQVQSFDNVKVYAADPWYDVQNGFIKDFFVVNGFTNDGFQPVIVLPKENIIQRNQLHLNVSTFFGSLYVLKKEFTVSFDVFPKIYNESIKEVFYLSETEISGIDRYRILEVWFLDDSEKLAINSAFTNRDTFVGSSPFELVKGKIIAEIPKLFKEFLVSFDVYPREFVAGWHSVIHFSIGSDSAHYGDRVPGIWFNADGKGGLHVSAPINGNLNRFFNTNPIGLNQWSNIEVSQILRNSVYVYTIKINKEIVFSEINNQVQSFDNVKVYAADPWYDVQNGLIKDFFVVNGITGNA
ncbi:uncharacterized protein LOC100215669 isoform X2 [Hydra vulgaris]|uniref:uncharacterized protein LOC100215669 isoform X2 n=1 Tax=Hydra vulgaris TaxID=6087 RepID=UPI001F5F497B|nr:uncharacterized protein LOC100215669 isoform X2 [Hydra vulgaris]